MAEGFIFYRSFYDAIKSLPAEEGMACLRAICRYGLDGEEDAETAFAQAILTMARPQIDANNKRREAGRSGGKAKATNALAKSSNDVASCSKPKQTVPKDKDKDKVKVKDKEKDIDLVILAWNGLPSSVPQISKMTDTRKRKLVQRIEENGIDKVLAAIEQVKASDFLLGKDGKWHITFDWFIEPRNFTKVIEGNYQNRTPARGFTAMENNSYDFDELERQLLEAQ